ncbi:MAG: Fe-S cluster assembly ATPase SufC [Acidimicrobiales bacterium]
MTILMTGTQDAPLGSDSPGGGPADPLLFVEDLHASADDNAILNGVDLVVRPGELHAVMGPNGSGKSTLANVLLGSPGFKVTKGKVLYKGEDITSLTPDARAKKGMFLAFQYPEEIPGVPIAQFLRQAVAARRGTEVSVIEVRVQIHEWLQRLGMDVGFASRYLNDGFSGGEKKRNEILQMALLEPDLAILDETDSGLDIDGVRVVARGVNEVRAHRPGLGVVVVTHYRRILDELLPDVIHVLIDGRIVESGGPELAARLDREGYESWRP